MCKRTAWVGLAGINTALPWSRSPTERSPMGYKLTQPRGPQLEPCCHLQYTQEPIAGVYRPPRELLYLPACEGGGSNRISMGVSPGMVGSVPRRQNWTALRALSRPDFEGTVVLCGPGFLV